MQELLERSFDFSIRLLELIKYLADEGSVFPLSKRLLICGCSIGVNLRMAELFSAKEEQERLEQALTNAVDCEYLLELMVKTGYLTQQQSMPIREDCHYLKEQIMDIKKDNKRGTLMAANRG